MHLATLLDVVSAAGRGPLPPAAAVVFALAFPIFWTLIVYALSSRSHMVRRLPVDPGPPVAKSLWGSARINGVSWRRCVRLITYADGWVVESMLVFGGRKVWLPRASTDCGPLVHTGLFGRAERVLNCGPTTVLLIGHLAASV